MTKACMNKYIYKIMNKQQENTKTEHNVKMAKKGVCYTKIPLV